MHKAIAIPVVLALCGFGAMNVFATRSIYKTICHHNPGNDVTLSFNNEQSYSGHLGTPHNDQVYDTDGPCVEVTPTVTVTPTVSPTDTPKKDCEGGEEYSIAQLCQPTPTVTPTPTASPSATPTPEVTTVTNNASSPECHDTVPGEVANLNVDSGVIGDGKVIVQWSLPTNADKVHIRYSENDGDWRYGALDVPNTGSYEIGGLTNNTHYWFQAAGVNGCAVGPWSRSFDPLP